MNLVGSIRRTSTKLYSGSKELRSICSGTNIASDWLRAELSCGWRRIKNKNGWRCRWVLHSLPREFVYLLTCGRRNLISGTQNDIVVSWITLWGMIKVYWLDLTTLAYIFDHAVCCASAESSGRSLHLITSQLRTKYSSTNCPNHVRRTMSSIKKRSKVRRILPTRFAKKSSPN